MVFDKKIVTVIFLFWTSMVYGQGKFKVQSIDSNFIYGYCLINVESEHKIYKILSESRYILPRGKYLPIKVNNAYNLTLTPLSEYLFINKNGDYLYSVGMRLEGLTIVEGEKKYKNANEKYYSASEIIDKYIVVK